MKRVAAAALSIILPILLFGCQNKGAIDSVSDTYKTQFEIVRVSFAQIGNEIFTSALNKDSVLTSGEEHLPIFRCQSMAELKRFVSDYEGSLVFSIEHGDGPSFESISKKYDDIFFEDNELLLIYISAGSGSYRFGLDSLDIGGQAATVRVKRLNNPAAVTMDLAGWLMSVGVNREMLKGCTEFDATLKI